jgi:hypothetical protein
VTSEELSVWTQFVCAVFGECSRRGQPNGMYPTNQSIADECARQADALLVKWHRRSRSPAQSIVTCGTCRHASAGLVAPNVLRCKLRAFDTSVEGYCDKGEVMP